MLENILVVDDHPIIFDYCHRELHEQYNVYYAANAEQLDEQMRSRTFSLVLMDIFFDQKPQGLEFIAKVKATAAKVLVFSGMCQAAEFRSVVQMDVDGYLDKNENTIISAIKEVLAGIYLVPRARVQAELGDVNDRLPSFTKQQRAVLNCFYNERSICAKEIANKMDLSIARVNAIIGALTAKLGQKRRNQMFPEALRRGYSPHMADHARALPRSRTLR